MKKKIEWWLVQADGKFWYSLRNREQAREDKKVHEDEIFEDWNSDVKYPLKIVRREYLLVNEKVVR